MVGCVLVHAAKPNIISNPVGIEPYQRNDWKEICSLKIATVFARGTHTKGVFEPQLMSLPNEKPLQEPNDSARLDFAHFNFTHEI